MRTTEPEARSGTEPASPGSTRRRSPWATLAVLAIAQFMVVLDVTIVNVALPDIQAELGFSRRRPAVGDQRLHARVRRLPAARRPGGRPARAGAACSWPAWRCSRSRRWPAGLATSPGALIARARGPGPRRRAAVARRAVAPDRHVRRTAASATSRWASGAALAGLGGTLGVVAGGVLVDSLGWEWVFFVNVPIARSLLVLARRVRARKPRPSAGARGASTSPARCSARPACSRSCFGVIRAEPLGLGLGRGARPARRRRSRCSAAFVAVEARSADPLVPLRLFRVRGLSMASGRARAQRRRVPRRCSS